MPVGPINNEDRSLSKINQILFEMADSPGLSGLYQTLAPSGGDSRRASLVKINSILKIVQDQGGWSGATPDPVGPWTAVPVDVSYAGGISTIQARWLIDPIAGLVQLRGSITG